MPTAAFAALALAAVSQAVFLLRPSRALDPFSPWLLAAAAGLLLATLAARTAEIGFVAVTSTFESLLLFSAAVGALLAVYRLRAGPRAMAAVLFGGTLIALCLLAVASSPLAPREALPPIPALRSHWLVLHVTFAFVGEAFFAVAFVAAIVSLAAPSSERRDEAARFAHRAVVIGYPIFTAGALIFGAIWAETAWGAYWSWDPKETWALITWLVYTAYLHTRLTPRLREPGAAAVLCIAGFLFTLFTFFGVNYLLSGLHSYG